MVMGEKSIGVKNSKSNEYRTGVIFVLICQLVWGVLPVYWQALAPIPSWIIILYRMLTMFIYTYIVARISYSREEIWAPLKEKGVFGRYLLNGILLTANWSIYVWAMTTGHMIQSSIGYYIEPIVICVFGVVFFKEKLTRYNLTAVILAAISLTVMLIHYGEVPGVALGLALTWATYSALKKSTDRPPILELVYETALLAVVAAAAIVFVEAKGIGALSYGFNAKYLLLFASGLVTLIPISLFGSAAKKVELFLIGLAQYISPTITLLLGIFAYKEPIDRVQVASFAIIWIGLVFFSYGEYKLYKERLQS